MRDVFKKGEISSVQDVGESDGDLGTGSTEITSPTLSATMSVSTTGIITSGGGIARWLFKDGRDIGYFDRATEIVFLGVGAGDVVYNAPYRDRPPVEPAAGLYSFFTRTMYTPSPDCSSGR